MNAVLEPTTVEDVIAAVHSTDRLLPIGARTKPRLCQAEATLLSTRKLTGVIEYQPSEYTITVRAGTPVAEVESALAQKGQYLPFDPPLAAAGATIGGTVAANLAGPGRFRYGGIRDFLIGIKLVDGRGRLLTGGGKVVKNAAGFDLPKLIVGSLGRLGILTELTFKVFPRPASVLTCRLIFDTHEAAMARLTELASSRGEPDALDYLPTEKSLYVRIGGPIESNASLAEEMGGDPIEADPFWPDLNHFTWAPPTQPLIKVPLTPRTYLALQSALDTSAGHTLHLTAGSATVYIATTDHPHLQSCLRDQNLRGLVLRGETESLWLGSQPDRAIDQALNQVFDPHQKFPDAT